MSQETTYRANIIIFFLGIGCTALLFFALLAVKDTKPYLLPRVAEAHIQGWLFDGSDFPVSNLDHVKKKYLIDLYHHANYQPLWLDSFELNKAGELLLQSLKETAADRWLVYDYYLNDIFKVKRRLHNEPDLATAMDIMLTAAFFNFAADVLSDRLLPDLDEGDHPPTGSSTSPAIIPASFSLPDYVGKIENKIHNQELFQLVHKLTPHHDGYAALREKFNLYYELAENENWLPLSLTQHSGDELKLGDSSLLVNALKERLKLLGDYKSSPFDWWLGEHHQNTDTTSSEQPEVIADIFDKRVQDALKQFQSRHHIADTGELNEETLSLLNTPPEAIAQRISFNMKRWRHLPKNIPDRYILVNMANYQLEMVEDDAVKLEMKVIIGKTHRRTPILTESMSTVVLSPTWNVPHRIAVGDILPKVRRDRNYLKKNHLQVIKGWGYPEKIVAPHDVNWSRFSRGSQPYRLRQSPGSHNSLGHVKFMLPNNQSIYLHDTSHRELFAKDMRALSSGCVRVEKPIELASFILQNHSGWNKNRIEKTINRRKTTYIPLKEKLPVYLLYWTTWVDKNGYLNVRPDVYNRDHMNKRISENMISL